MVANKSEQTVKDEILNLVKEYCNIYHCQKREFYEGGGEFHMLPESMIVRKW